MPFADGTEKPVWRVSMPPRGHRTVYALRMEAAVEAFYDWQGGLIWLRIDGEPEAERCAGWSRSHGGGHATLVRARLPTAPRYTARAAAGAWPRYRRG